MNKLLFIFIISLLCGCNIHSLDDFRHEAEGVCRALVEEFQRVETREDLLKSEAKLRRLFDELADLIITAQRYQKNHLDEAPLLSNSYEEPLLEEMLRIYRIEGGREIVERAQRESLIRLDSKIIK